MGLVQYNHRVGSLCHQRRSAANQDFQDTQVFVNTLACSSCGLCENFSCPQGLAPRSLIADYKRVPVFALNQAVAFVQDNHGSYIDELRRVRTAAEASPAADGTVRGISNQILAFAGGNDASHYFSHNHGMYLLSVYCLSLTPGLPETAAG